MSYNKETNMYEGYIYCITNNINNKKYIGQTNRTIKFRFQQHQYRSTNAKSTQPLYNAFRKYKIENFSVVELCKIEAKSRGELSELLNRQEILNIEKYNSKVPNGYNVLDGGNVNPTYLTSISVFQFDVNGNLKYKFNSISECLRYLGVRNEVSLKNHIYDCRLYKGYYWSFKNCIDISKYNRQSNPSAKHIYQYDLSGNLINSYLSLNCIDKNIISQNTVSNACNAFPHFAKGFIWLHTDIITTNDLENIKSYLANKKTKHKKTKSNRNKTFNHKTNKNAKIVYQFSLCGDFIKKWDSALEAALFVSKGKSPSCVVLALSGKISQSHGYLWSYENTPPSKYKTRADKFGKKVNKYDLNFNYIEAFDSVAEAAKSVGSKSYQAISCCCQGKTHHSFGYIWRYVGDNDQNPNLYYEKMGYMQPVDMFDSNEKYICSYKDMISVPIEYQPSLIKRCCENKIKKAYNCIWKFHHNANFDT